MSERDDFRYDIDPDFFAYDNDKRKCLLYMFKNVDFETLFKKYEAEKLTMMLTVNTPNGEEIVLYKFVCAGNFTDRITDYIVANFPNFQSIPKFFVYSGYGHTFEVYETDVQFPHKLEQ